MYHSWVFVIVGHLRTKNEWMIELNQSLYPILNGPQQYATTVYVVGEGEGVGGRYQLTETKCYIVRPNL